MSARLSTGKHQFKRSTGMRIAVALFLIGQPPLGAVVITVDGGCTLVDAIDAANSDSPVGGCAAGSGADQILLTADVALTAVNNTSSGSNGLPVVTSDITIDGSDFAIDRASGSPLFRILMVEEPGVLTLESVTVSGGSTGSAGGGILNNGGVLTLKNTTVSGNESFGFQGGGIANGEFFGPTPGTTTLIESLVTDNYSYNGGGVYNAGGELSLIHTTVSNNLGVLAGGVQTYNGTETTLYGSTITGNGSFYSSAVINHGHMTLTNSTVSGNLDGPTAVTNYSSGTLEFFNSTIAGNLYTGGINNFGSATFTNSILGLHTSNNCGGIVTDGGGNFSDDDSCPAGFAFLTGLDTLADNGGPTLTHALLAGSSAIDGAGDCGLAADQRGVPRDDGACDSGAYEFVSDPCVLQVRLGANAGRPGEALEVELLLQHNRPKTVTVPFRIWIEDATGAIIASRTTPQVTLEPGENFRRRFGLTLPVSVARGRYFVRARIDQMHQGMAESSRRPLRIE